MARSLHDLNRGRPTWEIVDLLDSGSADAVFIVIYLPLAAMVASVMVRTIARP